MEPQQNGGSKKNTIDLTKKRSIKSLAEPTATYVLRPQQPKL